MSFPSLCAPLVLEFLNFPPASGATFSWKGRVTQSALKALLQSVSRKPTSAILTGSPGGKILMDIGSHCKKQCSRAKTKL